MTIEHMAENIPGATEAPSSTTLSATPPKELPIYRAANFDPNRKDYQAKTIGKDVIYIDPLTGAEVARMPRVAGGAGELERPGGVEDIWSPEFQKIGINIARQIVELEAQSYQFKYYTGLDGPLLDKLYKDWKNWVRLNEHRSYQRKPFRQPQESEPPQTNQQEQVQPDNLADVRPLGELATTYNELRNRVNLDVNGNVNPDAERLSNEQLGVVRSELSRHFKEAKRRSFLDGVDDSLRKLYKTIRDSLDEKKGVDEIWQLVASRGQAMSSLAQTVFEEVFESSPSSEKVQLNKLRGAWSLYIDLALNRFALLLNKQGLVRPPSIDGEFDFKIDDSLKSLGVEGIEQYRKLIQEGEVFWRPTYGKYFEVSARRSVEFQIALDTFAQWIRTEVTKDPAELFALVTGFKEAFSAACVRETKNLPEGFTGRARREMEALIGVMGADWANEHYNDDYYRQFMTLIAKEEGPARFAGLARIARGKVAAALWKFDKDPKFELLFSPHGSRGQLMEERNPIEMEQLQEQIKNMLIAEIVGVEIKGYDPRDPQKRLNNQAFEDNLDELVKFKSDEGFQDLFEGFNQRDQNDLYEQLRGRDDSQLRPAEKQLKQRMETVRRIQQHLLNGRSPSELTAEDRFIYQEAKNAVTLAYELYGVMGEKAKRGGGVFLVERKNYYVETFKKLQNTADNLLTEDQKRDKKKGEILFGLWTGRKTSQQLTSEERQIYAAMSYKERQKDFFDYIPIHFAEKFVQFAENWTKATYGHLSAAEVTNRVAQARKLALWALKRDGFDAQLFDFTLTIDGKIVDPETFLGTDQFGSRDKDGNIHGQPLHPNMLGYDKNSKPVTLSFDQDGKPVGIELNPAGKTVIYDKPANDPNRKLIYFDKLDGNTRANRIRLKIPRGTINSETGKKIVKDVESIPVDFNRATHHIYSCWTGHPYWGYQEQDTGLLLTDESFADAQKIKQGLLRPEDARPHAVQLLILDPTLERVAHFAHQEKREDKIALAAVEDSYQGHWRITDQLYQAFFPDDADDEKIRVAYVLQDHGGSTKTWFHARALATRWADMAVRRLRTLTPILPLHFTSMAEMWGAPSGGLDVLRMMNYGNGGEAGGYRMVGQFALEKWIRQTAYAEAIREALFGFVSDQEKRSREGLGEKPTNDADALQRWYEKLDKLIRRKDPKLTSRDEGIDNQFINAVRESLGRFEAVFHRVRVMETDIRGERGPLWLEGVDIFLKNDLIDKKTGKILVKKGDFNPNIDTNRNTGSSRHSGDIFFWRFVKWLRSDKEGEGQALYPTEAMYYEFMDDYTVASRRKANIGDSSNEQYDPKKLQTRWAWLLGKLNR